LHGIRDDVVPVQTSSRYLNSLKREGKGSAPLGGKNIGGSDSSARKAINPSSSSSSSSSSGSNIFLQLVPDGHALDKHETLQVLLKTLKWQWELEGGGGEKQEEARGEENPKKIALGGGGQDATKQTVEVERKLMVPENLIDQVDQIINQAGGELVAVQSFEDRYWDIREEWLLARNSCWLRQRGGMWELKVPLQSVKTTQTGDADRDGSGGGEAAAEVYQEILGENQIWDYLKQRWTTQFASAAASGKGGRPVLEQEGGLENVLKQCGLSVYAHYRTRREKYRMRQKEGGDSKSDAFGENSSSSSSNNNNGYVEIDMDTTDYGSSRFTVLEIEKVVDSDCRDQIEQANKELDHVASRLILNETVARGEEEHQTNNSDDDGDDLVEGGVSTPEMIPRGKLTEYIRRYEPGLFRIMTNMEKFSNLAVLLDDRQRWVHLTDNELGGFEIWTRNKGIVAGPIAHGLRIPTKRFIASDGEEEKGEGEGAGRGIFAKQYIEEGALLVELPSELVLRVQEDEQCPEELIATYGDVWKNYDEWYVRLGVKLLIEQQKQKSQKDSKFAGYLGLLPDSIDHGAPIVWTEEQLEVGLGYYPTLKASVERQKEKWSRISSELSAMFPEFSPKELQLAFYHCLSRAFKGDFGRPMWQAFVPGLVLLKEAIGESEDSYVLLPYVDSHNHNSSVTTNLEFQPRRQVFELRSGKDYASGEEVMISYGALSNDELLQRFGFVETNNPHDVLRIPKSEFENALDVMISGEPALKSGVTLLRNGQIQDEESVLNALARVAQGNGQARAGMKKVIKELLRQIEDYGEVTPSRMGGDARRAELAENFRQEKLRILKEAKIKA